jgi:ribonuclease BN (tRNA processing enzyme)
MKLVVLGSGTSVPHPRRAAPAFWLEADGGKVLLDCGADTAHRMAEENLDWSQLDVIWISHLHLDHCGGLASFLFGMKWAPQTQARRKPLTIFGCEGVANLLHAINDANNYRLFEQPFPIKVQEISANQPGPSTEFEILPGLRAQTFSTPHTGESLAIRLTDQNGVSLVYTSDTSYSEDVGRFANSADLLILECSFRANKPVAKHLELSEVMRLARLAAPRKLVLTHFYPEWDGFDIEAEAKAQWPGQTIAAIDGLIIDI